MVSDSVYVVTFNEGEPQKVPTLARVWETLNSGYSSLVGEYGEREGRWKIEHRIAGRVVRTAEETMDEAIWECHSEGPKAFSMYLNAFCWPGLRELHLS